MRPRISRPITFSSRSAASAPAARRTPRKLIVIASPYAGRLGGEGKRLAAVLLVEDDRRAQLRGLLVGQRERQPRVVDEIRDLGLLG